MATSTRANHFHPASTRVARMKSMDEQNLTPLPIGALLVERGLIDNKDIDKALTFQRQFKGRLGAILVRIGALSEDALLPVLGAQLGISLATESNLPHHSEAILKGIEVSKLNAGWFVDQRALLWEEGEGADADGIDPALYCASRNAIDSNLRETWLLRQQGGIRRLRLR